MTLVQRRMLRLLGLSCFVGAAFFALQRDRQRLADAHRDSTQQGKLLAALEGAEVRRLTLHAPQESFVLLREGDGPEAPWMIESPLRTLADDSVVQGMIHTLTEASVKRTLGGDPAPQDAGRLPHGDANDLAMFGLAPPLYHLTVSGPAADGNEHLAVVMLGKKNSFDNTLYAKRAGAGPVLLVGAELLRAVDKDLFALRDKRPLPLVAGEVERLVVQQERAGKHPGRAFALHKEDGHFVVQPMSRDAAAAAGDPFVADDGQVDTLLGALTGLRAKRVVAEAGRTATDEARLLQTFGMRPPKVAVSLTFRDGAGGSGDANLLFGQVILGDAPNTFVKRQGNYPVLELGSDWALKKLAVPLEELRDLHVSQFDPDAVQQIRLQQGGARLQLQKTSHPDDAAGAHLWHVTGQDGSRGAELQDVKVIGLLYKLKDLRAQRFIALRSHAADLRRHGLDAPQRSVELLDDKGKVIEALQVGRSDASTTYVQRRGASWFGPVTSSSLDDVVVDPNHFVAQ